MDVLATAVRRCVWSRNLVNDKALAHWGLSRQRQRSGGTSQFKIQIPFHTMAFLLLRYLCVIQKNTPTRKHNAVFFLPVVVGREIHKIRFHFLDLYRVHSRTNYRVILLNYASILHIVTYRQQIKLLFPSYKNASHYIHEVSKAAAFFLR
jgi:hypothetical protein